MASMESKSAAKRQAITIEKYLIKGEQQARDPQWHHGVSQRTLCTSDVCAIQGHVRCQHCDATGPARPHAPRVAAAAAKHAAQEAFQICSLVMGKCAGAGA